MMHYRLFGALVSGISGHLRMSESWSLENEQGNPTTLNCPNQGELKQPLGKEITYMNSAYMSFIHELQNAIQTRKKEITFVVGIRNSALSEIHLELSHE